MRSYGYTFTAAPFRRTSTITRPSSDVSLTPTPGVTTLRRTISRPSEFPDVTRPSFTLESSGSAGSGGAGIDPSYLPPSWSSDDLTANTLPSPAGGQALITRRSGAGRPGASESGRQPRWWRQSPAGSSAFFTPRGATRTLPAPTVSPFSPGTGPATTRTLPAPMPSFTPGTGTTDTRTMPTPTPVPLFPSIRRDWFQPLGARPVPPPRYPAPPPPRYPAPPPRAPYPAYPAPMRPPPAYQPFVPYAVLPWEFYSTGFGPEEAVAEMPAKADAVVAEPVKSSMSWLLLAGLAAAGFVAYKYVAKRRAGGGAS